MNARILHRLSACGMLAAVFLLAGCQDVFTYAPLSFLQRAPSSMSHEQAMNYAEQALASGDEAAMKAAFEALKDDTSDSGMYLAAQLAIEVSGISDFLVEVVTGAAALPDTGDSATLTDWLSVNSSPAQEEYLIAAADRLAAVNADDLTTMDYVYGSLGMALDAATQPDGTVDFAAADPVKLDAAQAFMQSALDGMSPDDPSYAFLDSYNTYLKNI
jgi:hypothetical protein